nr:helix-turn-helix transcriptional regulator [uncultured Hyphomonas sp.]
MEHNFSNMAQFISTLRKEKELTQKDLAEQLGVTDKAVSKWERGLSCPDISLLAKLSEILGVTTSELLKGEKADAPAPEMEAVVESTLRYADQSTQGIKSSSKRWKSLAIIAGVLLLSVLNAGGKPNGDGKRPEMADPPCQYCHLPLVGGHSGCFRIWKE